MTSHSLVAALSKTGLSLLIALAVGAQQPWPAPAKGVAVLSAQPLSAEAAAALGAGGARAIAQKLGAKGYRVYWSGDDALVVVASKSSPADMAPSSLSDAALATKTLEGMAAGGGDTPLSRLPKAAKTWIDLAAARAGGLNQLFVVDGAGWSHGISLAQEFQLYLIDDRVVPPRIEPINPAKQIFTLPPVAEAMPSAPRAGCALWYFWPQRNRGWSDRQGAVRSGPSNIASLLTDLTTASQWPITIDADVAGRAKRPVYVYGTQVPHRDLLWGLEILSGLRLADGPGGRSWRYAKVPAANALAQEWWSSLPGGGYVNPALTARGRATRARGPYYHKLQPAIAAWSLSNLPPMYTTYLAGPTLQATGRDASQPDKLTVVWLWGLNFEYYSTKGKQGTGRGIWLPAI